MKTKLFFILLVTVFCLLGAFSRLYQIQLVPASISYDELDHVINGQSIFYTGKDIQGEHFFWELYPTQTHTFTAELSGLWHSFVSFLPLPNFTIARLPNVIAGFVASGGFAFFVYQVFRSRKIALIVLALMLVSPWHILLSRTAYEAPIALAWLIISIVFFWQMLEKRKNKQKIIYLALTIFCMLASFYTYHGYKMLFPFIFFLVFLWNRKTSIKTSFTKKGIKEISNYAIPLILFFWLVVFSLFSYRLNEGHYGNRTSEISILNTEGATQKVNTVRQGSLENQYKSLFINKGTVLSDQIENNFLESFDPAMLFFSGFDKSYVLGLWEHGFLYIIQLPLILVGFMWASKYKSRDTIFLLILVLISIIPVVIHTNTSVALRSGLLIPILILFSALGAYVLIANKYFGKPIVVTVLFLVTLVSVFRFQHMYFFRFPINNIDTSLFQERLAAGYVARTHDEGIPVIVFANEPYNSIRVTAFSAGLIKRSTIEDWQKILSNPRQGTYIYGNLTFTNECKHADSIKPGRVIVASPDLAANCNLENHYASYAANLKEKNMGPQVIVLPSPRDNHDYYRVFNDQLCKNRFVPGQIWIKKAQDFKIETLTPDDLCSKWTKIESFRLKKSS